MLDLKYLTLNDLDKLAEALKQELAAMQNRSHSDTRKKSGDQAQQLIENQRKLIDQVESELLERSLLECGNPGGATT